MALFAEIFQVIASIAILPVDCAPMPKDIIKVMIFSQNARSDNFGKRSEYTDMIKN
jgi:hypothetical protein